MKDSVHTHKFSTSLIFLILFFIPILLFSQNSPTATNTELVFQVENAPANSSTKFRYSSVSGTAFLYATGQCSFTPSSDFMFSQTISVNHTGDSYFASIISDDSVPVENYEMTHALIKVEIINGYTTQKIFYYDIRDYQYYACYNLASDITLRYNYEDNKLWFINTLNTSSAPASVNTGWEEVSASSPTTKKTWEVFGFEHCIVTAPRKPTGLTSSFSGIHPRLDWDENTEPNLSKYYVYKQDVTSNFQYFASTTNNYYIDYSETKHSPGNQKQYIKYKVKAVNTDNEASLSSDPVTVIVNENDFEKKVLDGNDFSKETLEYSLSKNYPNPFNPATTIYYSIKKEGRVLLTVHNLLGEQVSVLINEVKPKGKYRVVFNAGQLANGIYFYKLCVNDYVAIDKMTLIK